MGQGLFESDDDYQQRVTREANEATIEDLKGAAPTQRWFEGDDAYRSRIADEAYSATIENHDGNAPVQRFFESDSRYRERLAREANEATIESLSGSEPVQRLFESNDDYNHRVRYEANLRRLESSDEALVQGLFERDVDFRRRVSLAARESRSKRVTSKASTGRDSYSADQGQSEGFGISSIFILIVLGLMVLSLFGPRVSQTGLPPHEEPVSAPAPKALQRVQVQSAFDASTGTRLEERRRPFCVGNMAITADWAVSVVCGSEALRLQASLVDLLDQRVAIRGENSRGAIFSSLASASGLLWTCAAFHPDEPGRCLMQRLRGYVEEQQNLLATEMNGLSAPNAPLQERQSSEAQSPPKPSASNQGREQVENLELEDIGP